VAQKWLMTEPKIFISDEILNPVGPNKYKRKGKVVPVLN
jgi:hypothetical protein